MSARVLIVDDIEMNIRVLELRLREEYFEVATATNGPDALTICQSGQCDVVLLDVMMPGMDGYEVCRRLKADAKTAHIPVIMVTALDQSADKVKGLDAGADDFLTKPVDTLALLTRVKSLARLKLAADELQMRAATGADLGVGSEEANVDPQDGRNGSILIVDDRAASYESSLQALSQEHTVEVITDPQDGLFRAADGEFDAILISLGMEEFDPLRLCSQLRSLDRTRNVPILLVARPDDQPRLMRALDIGVNDYITRPVDKNELRARMRSQVRRKRLNEQLRASVQNTMEMAVTDGLTGLHNRRYFDSHMRAMMDRATVSGKPLALIIMDIDHFKLVNDTYGHQAGDDVLRTFAQRLSKNVRGKDLACRFGGEEFVIAMPDTDQQLAFVVADRMRREMAAHPFIVDSGKTQIAVTVSAGVAVVRDADDTMADMLRRADERLYEAKRNGRNQVVAEAA